MKIYLVGGAVRDELLGLAPLERDWVVVGSTAHEMLDLGYKQVGKDFPVFLHPKTKEEYALARTERKVGQGYHGFSCDFSPTTTIEEDLKRRDLTINAIAKSETAELIDPYGGVQDLNKKIIRHVSEAFVEDPLRVLRVARFYSILPSFTISTSTITLIHNIANSGELKLLTPQRVYMELKKVISRGCIAKFIDALESFLALRFFLPTISSYAKDKPEQYEQVLFFLKSAQKKGYSEEQIIALLIFFEVGMSTAKKVTKIDSLEAVKKAKRCIEKFSLPNIHREISTLLIKQYSTIVDIKKSDPSAIVKLLTYVDAYRKPARFKQLIDLVVLISKNDHTDLFQMWSDTLNETKTVELSDLLGQNLSGEQLKEAIYARRIELIKKINN